MKVTLHTSDGYCSRSIPLDITGCNDHIYVDGKQLDDDDAAALAALLNAWLKRHNGKQRRTT